MVQRDHNAVGKHTLVGVASEHQVPQTQRFGAHRKSRYASEQARTYAWAKTKFR